MLYGGANAFYVLPDASGKRQPFSIKLKKKLDCKC